MYEGKKRGLDKKIFEIKFLFIKIISRKKKTTTLYNRTCLLLR